MNIKEYQKITNNLDLITPYLNPLEQNQFRVLKICLNHFKEDKKMTHIDFLFNINTLSVLQLKPRYENENDKTLITLRHKRYYKGLEVLENKCTHLKEVSEYIQFNCGTNFSLNKDLSNVNVLIDVKLAQKLLELAQEKITQDEFNQFRLIQEKSLNLESKIKLHRSNFDNKNLIDQTLKL
jgi:hypothetical protein